MVGRGWNHFIAPLMLASWLTVALVSSASAQSPPIAALEEEINLLKETIETNNREIRKLRERVGKLEASAEEHTRALAELRRRITGIDVLQKALQALEAKLAEVAASGGGGGQGAQLGVHADVRIRPEYTQNRTDVNDDVDDQDAFYGHRIRFGGDFGFDDWVRARVTVQESRKFGSHQSGGGDIGVHEAWIELAPPLLPGLRLRGGRTELAYGGERLVGRDDFSSTGRAFDGGFAEYNLLPYIEIEAFYAKIRESEDGNDNDFFGAVLRTEAIPFVTLEIYYMGLLDEQQRQTGVGDSTVEQTIENRVHTMGARAEALLFDDLRLELEAIVQLGTRTDDEDFTKELDHFATAYFAEISYAIPVTTYPTFGSFFAYASGDANPTDGNSIDFQPLFGTRHTFLGKMDMFTWQNMMDVGAVFEMSPPLGFGVHVAFHWFMMAQKRGRLATLGDGGTPERSVGRNIGGELDIVLSWAPNDNLELEGGYSVFFPTTVPEQLGVGDDLAMWAYFQARVRY